MFIVEYLIKVDEGFFVLWGCSQSTSRRPYGMCEVEITPHLYINIVINILEIFHVLNLDLLLYFTVRAGEIVPQSFLLRDI